MPNASITTVLGPQQQKEFLCNGTKSVSLCDYGHTAAEIIHAEQTSTKPHMGLTTWKYAPDGAGALNQMSALLKLSFGKRDTIA